MEEARRRSMRPDSASKVSETIARAYSRRKTLEGYDLTRSNSVQGLGR